MSEIANCGYDKQYTSVRFGLYCVTGFTAIIGIALNILLITLFTIFKPRQPILASLAILDSLLCATYVALFGGEATSTYFRLAKSYDVFYSYVIPAFVLSRMVQIAIPCMLILNTVERWAWLASRREGGWRILHSVSGRVVLCGITFLVSTCTRLPMAFALEVHTYLNCTNYFTSKELWPNKFYISNLYRQYDIYLTTLQIIVPFVVLFALNSVIVRNLHSARRKRQLAILDRAEIHLLNDISISAELNQQMERTVARQRDAIFAMAVFVASYLVCNSFHVALYIVESWGDYILRKEDRSWSLEYLFATDVLNFLFMLCSASRIFVYYGFNRRVSRRLTRLGIGKGLPYRKSLIGRRQQLEQEDYEEYGPGDSIRSHRKNAIRESSLLEAETPTELHGNVRAELEKLCSRTQTAYRTLLVDRIKDDPFRRMSTHSQVYSYIYYDPSTCITEL